MQHHFALIGCGSISERHAENIVKKGTLAAVCDIVPEKADTMATKFNATPYYSIEDLLNAASQLTVAVICTPNGLHASHAIQALGKGLHVLCEKPLCISEKDGRKMIKAAEKAGKYLFVVKQNRFNPPVAELKKLCEEKRLGNIRSFQINCFWNRPEEYYQNSTWKGTKELDGGILYTQFSHFIDLLYWILGDVKDVRGIRKNFSHPCIEIEDSGVVILEMQSGAIGTLNYTINSFKKNMEGSITLFGDAGTVKIGGEYLNILEYQSIKDHKVEVHTASASANDYGYYTGSMSNHDKVYDQLFNALQGDTHQMTDAEEGLKTVEIIEKIYRVI